MPPGAQSGGVCDVAALDFPEICPVVQESPRVGSAMPLFTKLWGPVPDVSQGQGAGCSLMPTDADSQPLCPLCLLGPHTPLSPAPLGTVAEAVPCTRPHI